jgi:hypothetical protein
MPLQELVELVALVLVLFHLYLAQFFLVVVEDQEKIKQVILVEQLDLEVVVLVNLVKIVLTLTQMDQLIQVVELVVEVMPQVVLLVVKVVLV